MTSRIYFILVLSLLSLGLWGQGQVLPGDANANGRVDHYDILPMAFAFGHIGPSREAGEPDEPQDIIALWPSAFPNGTNFIHADANGNGRVDISDFALLATNQGLEDGIVDELAFLQTFNGTGSILRFNEGEDINPATAPSSMSIPVHVQSTPDAEPLNGLAFEIEFDPTYVESAYFSFSDEWINEGGQVFPFVSYDENRIKVAVSRLGSNPISEGGLLGRLNVIIVEDLIGIIPPTPDNSINFVVVNDIVGVDGEFGGASIVGQGLAFGPLNSISSTSNPKTNNRLEAKLSPNPAHDEILVQSVSSFTKIELFDLQGRQKILYSGPARNRWHDRLNELPVGMYFLRLQGDQGQSLLRFIYSAE